MDLFREAGGVFILGNHELRVLERFRLAPRNTDCSDRPAFCGEFRDLEPDDLAGDGRRPFDALPERRGDVLRFLQGHAGFFLEDAALDKAGPTPDGRPWCAVHAGLVPGKHPAMCTVEELVSVRRLPGRGRPYWYEVYSGPNLILFGPHAIKGPTGAAGGWQAGRTGAGHGLRIRWQADCVQPRTGRVRPGGRARFLRKELRGAPRNRDPAARTRFADVSARRNLLTAAQQITVCAVGIEADLY